MGFMAISRKAGLAAASFLLLAACAAGPLSPSGPPRSDEVFSHVQSGMTTDEVRQILGAPDETMRFPLSNTFAWDYRYYDTWGYLAVFSVTFGPDGRAASKLSWRINMGGDHGA